MKLSEGLTKLVPSILIFVFYGFSFLVFTMALKKIDLSVAYAIWAGTGTALIALIGIAHFKEPFDTDKSREHRIDNHRCCRIEHKRYSKIILCKTTLLQTRNW